LLRKLIDLYQEIGFGKREFIARHMHLQRMADESPNLIQSVHERQALVFATVSA
jgi:hypothetical protein